MIRRVMGGNPGQTFSSDRTLLVIALLMLVRIMPAQADLFIKANNTTALDVNSSWAGGTGTPTPLGTDNIQWDATVLANTHTATLGTHDLSVQQIIFITPGGNSHGIAYTAGQTLTIGSGGVDMSTGTRSTIPGFLCDVVLGAAQTMNVGPASGRTLTFGRTGSPVPTFSGSAKLTKSGVGILNFNGNASGFSGELEISAGTVGGWQIGLGDMTGAITFSGNSTLTPSSAMTLASGRTITINDGVTATINAGVATTIEGVIQDGGLNTGALTKSGTGVLTLNGANTYGGTTRITAGSLRATDGTGLPTAGNLTLAGGVWESGVDIARDLGTGGGQVQLTLLNSGFGAVGNDISVTLSGGAGLTWATGSFNPGTTLSLNPVTSDHNLNFVNAINLNNGARTIVVGATNANDGAAVVATVSGGISSTTPGSGSLTKTGAGILYLPAASGYTGNTTINGAGGALRARDGTGVHTDSRVIISAGIWESDQNITRTAAATGAGTVGISAGTSGFGAAGADITVTLGGGDITWAVANKFNPTIFQLNHLHATNAITFANNISFTTAARTVQVTTNTATLSGILSSTSAAGGLTKTGIGKLILGGNNTYTGPTLVNAGVLEIDSEARLGNNPAGFTAAQLSVTDTLRVTTTFSIDDSNRGVTVLGTTDALPSAFEVPIGLTLTIANPIAGAGRLTKSGPGRLILSNSGNTYGGTTQGTRLLQGTVEISADGQLGTAGADLLFTGDSTLHATASLTLNALRAITINAGVTGTFEINNGAEVGVAGAIGNTAGALRKTGLGTLTLSAANLYDGGTFIEVGTVKLGINNALPPAANDHVVIDAGAFLDMAGFNATIDRLTGLGTVTNSSLTTASTLTVGITALDNFTTDILFTDGGAPGTLGLTKGAGTGVMTLTNTGNDYSGTTRIDAGTLRLGASGVIPNGPGKGNVVPAGAGDTFDLNGFDETINGLDLLGVVTNSTGAATLTFGDGDANGNYTGLIRDGVGSTLELVKIGTGTQTFGTASSHAYSGDLTINAGKIYTSAANVLGDGAGRGNVVIGAAGTLDIGGNADTINGLSGSGIVTNSAASATDIFTIGANDTSSTFSGSIRDGSAVIELNKTGSGTLELSGANTHSGQTEVLANGGVLRIAHANALGQVGVASTSTLIGNNGALELVGGITFAAEPISIVGAGVANDGVIRNVSGVNTLTGLISMTGGAGVQHRINADAGSALIIDVTVAEAIDGTSQVGVFGGEGDITVEDPLGWTTGGLIKDGGGTLRLNGTTTAMTSGGATVEGGTMLINGALSGTTFLTVNDGAALGGGGSTTRAVTNLAGSVMAPGDPLVASGIGTFTTKQWELAAGCSNIFEITSEAVRDQVIVQNNNGLRIDGGAFYLYLPGTATPVTADGNYDLIQFTGTIQGAGLGSLTWENSGGKDYEFVEAGGWVRLKISSAKSWDGLGSDNYWNTGDNWTDDNPPSPGQELQFNTGNRLYNTNDTGVGVQYAGITFIDGAGAFVLDGDLINLTSRIVNNDADTQTINLDLELDGNDRELQAVAGDLVINGDVTSASYGLIKNGAETATLAGNNSYVGATAVDVGALRAASPNALGSTAAGTTVADGAALEVAGNITTAAEALSLTGAGVASGGALRNVSGDNTYAGVVTMAANSRISADSGSSLTLDVSTISAILGAGLEVTFAGDGDINVIDGVDTSVAGSVVKVGNGTTTLMDNNDYRGFTSIQAGALRVGNTLALGTATLVPGTEVFSGAALELTNNVAPTETITLTGTGVANGGALRNVGDNNSVSATMTLGAGGARINSDSGTLTFRGVVTAVGNDLTVGGAGGTLNNNTGISGGGRLIKDGSGNFTLAVTGTYQGDTIVTNGTLTVGGNNVIPNGATAGDVYVYSPATLDVTTGTDTINGLHGNGTVNNSTVTARLLTVGDNNASSTFSGTITNSGSTISVQLTKIGSGTLTLLGTNWWGGVTIVSGGTLQIGDGNDYGTLGVGDVTVTSPGVLVFNRSDAISQGSATVEINGTGNVTKEGAGALTLNGVNTFSGTLTINAGTVIDGNAAESLANTMDLTVANGATFDLNNANETVDLVTLTDGNLISTGSSGFLNGTSFLAYNGSISAKLGGAAATFVKNGAGTVTLTRTGSGYAGKTSIYQGTLSIVRLDNLSLGSSLGAPTTVGNGTIELGSGANSATLRFAASGDGASTSDRVIDLIGTTGTVTIDASGAALAEALTLTSNFAATGAGAKTLVLTGTNAGTNTIAGAIVDGSGTTSLTKNGTGTWTLSGASTYTGATAIDQGTLVVNGSLAAGSAVSINNGGTLMGIGTLAGAVAHNSGGTLAPGESIGELTVGSLDLNAGSITEFEFTLADNDTIVVSDSGGLNIDGGGIYLYAEGGTTAWTDNGIYNLIQYSGGLTGDEDNLTVLNPGGGKTYDFVADGSWVKLIISDGLPLMYVGDAAVMESDSGQTGMVFNITIHEASASLVTGNYTTQDGSAKDALGDYDADSGTFEISIGALSTQVIVQVNGDTDVEGDEAFSLVVSGVANASIVDATGTGTITNDDAFAGTWFVDDSATGGNDSGLNWSDAFTNLQSALSAVSGGEEIWVAAGTYKPGTLSTDKFVVPQNVSLYGGFAGTESSVAARVDPTANPAILSGDMDDSGTATSGDATKLVECASGGGQVVDGFTIQHTYFNGSSGAGDLGGGGVRILGPNTTIRKCIIRAHYANYGAALGIQTGAGNGQLIENCVFTENNGPGPSSVAGYYRGGTTTFRHCTFFGNAGSVSDGTWQARSGGDYTLENVITWDSSATWPGGFKRNDVSLPTVNAYNCEINDTGWNNGTGAGQQGTGTGMRNADPLFVDDTTPPYDLRLQAGSDAFNTGDNSRSAATDIKGVARPQGATVDIGAYERPVVPQYAITVAGSPENNYDVRVTADQLYLRVTPFGPEAFDSGTVTLLSAMLTNVTSETRLRFNGWDDGDQVFNANPLNFTLGVATNYTLLYAQQYKANANASGGTVTMDPVDGWTNAGSIVEFSQAPNIGFNFNHWEDNLGTDLGTAEPLVVTLTAPTNIVAIYDATGEAVTVQTSPAGLNFNGDGEDFTNIHVFSWEDPSTHYLYATNPQPISATEEKRVSRWNDPINGDTSATNLSFEVSGPGPYTITVHFDTFFKLTTSAVNGTITNWPVSPDGFYEEGDVVELYADPDNGYVLSAWGGDASGDANPVLVTVSSAKTVSATFTRVYFVDASATGADNGLGWANAYDDLHQALTAAPAGSEFWVAAGTYTNAAVNTPLVVEPDDVLYGGFAGTESVRSGRDIQANVTVITGDPDGNGTSDMANVPLMTSSGANTAYATVDGFTFRRGNVTSGAHFGGAISTTFNLTGFRIYNCMFHNNTGQYGGAVGTRSPGAPTIIVNSIFYANTAVGGTYGGAFYNRAGAGQVMNSTFFGNSAGGSQDDVYRHISCTLAVQNSILWSAAPIGGELPTITYSTVRGGAGGTGNLSSNPQFVSEGSFDLRLQAGSPAIDSASSSGAPAFDYRGYIRPVDGDGIGGAQYDRGAYEMGAFYNANLSSTPVSGRSVTLAGNTQSTPHTFSMESGSVIMSVTSPQTVGVSTNYVFNNWDDGAGLTPVANPYTFTAVHATNWTAAFSVQYLATGRMDPAIGAGTLATNPADGWVDAGNPVTFTATANPPFGFDHWEDTSGANLGAVNPLTIAAVTTPTNIIAIFNCAGSTIDVQTSPVGLDVNVEAVDITTPQTFCWIGGSSKYLYVTNPQPVSATEQYRFTGWADTTAQSAGTTNWSYTVPGVDATVTASFNTWYKLTLTANASHGSVATNVFSGDGFYVTGQIVQLTATPAPGYVFANWSGDQTGSANPVSVTMSAAKSITANFQRVYFVDQDVVGGLGNGLGWANAYASLQAALTAASAGAEFWVAAGTYFATPANTSMTLETSDAIYGGFAGNESLRAERDWTNNVTTITGDSTGDNVSDMTSAPLLVSSGANTGTVTVDGFTLEYGNLNVAAATYGAAIRNMNTAGFTVDHCVFRHNYSAGKAADCGGGAIGQNYGTFTIRNSLFYDNNTGRVGGAIAQRRGTMSVINCTFEDNSASSAGDDVFLYETSMVVRNCILWSMSAIGHNGIPPTVSYSDVRFGFAGTGNINSDPLFFDQPLRDYRLGVGSPALNIGTATGAPADDLNGTARPVSSGYDMGAYEGAVAGETMSIFKFK